MKKNIKPARPTLLGDCCYCSDELNMKVNSLLYGKRKAKHILEKRKHTLQEENRKHILRYANNLLVYIINRIVQENNLEIKCKPEYGFEYDKDYETTIENSLDILKTLLKNDIVLYEDFHSDMKEIKRVVVTNSKNKKYNKKFSFHCLFREHEFIQDDAIPYAQKCKYCNTYE